jgi:hypothetical protein
MLEQNKFSVPEPGPHRSHYRNWAPAYATADLFDSLREDIFFPARQANGQLPGCQDKIRLFFCDNCSIHCLDQLLKEFAEKGVSVITYPLQTSNLFQILDALLFGPVESTKRYVPTNDVDSAAIGPFARIFKADETVTTVTSVRASWMKAGFES